MRHQIAPRRAKSVESARDHNDNEIRVGDFAQVLYDEWNRPIPHEKLKPFRVDEIRKAGNVVSLFTNAAEWVTEGNPNGTSLIGRARRCAKVG